MRIYTETPFRMTPPRMAVVHPEIGTASSLLVLEAQRRAYDRDVALMGRGLRRDLLPLFWRQVLEIIAEKKEASAEAMRPSIGKPLSRRARRRNRGRVRAAKAALLQRFTPSMEWSWSQRDAA